MTSFKNVVALSLVTLSAAALFGCAAGWERSYFTLEDALTNPDISSVTNEKDETERLCDGLAGCIEGWTTDSADFLRFDSNEAARDFAATLGENGYHSNRVVIDFEGARPDAETRQLMVEVIESIHNSE